MIVETLIHTNSIEVPFPSPDARGHFTLPLDGTEVVAGKDFIFRTTAHQRPHKPSSSWLIRKGDKLRVVRSPTAAQSGFSVLLTEDVEGIEDCAYRRLEEVF